MELLPTERLYLLDDHLFEADARLLAIEGNALALDRTCFYPGGGGQPPDEGSLILPDGTVLQIGSAYSDAAGVIWHVSQSNPFPASLGLQVHLAIDRPRREILTRYHTVLHVLNSIVLHEYGGWITGVQIAADHSRIDFKLDSFFPAMCAGLEARVNAVLAEDYPLKSYTISEIEYNHRPDLLRTFDVKPPLVDGRLRVVEIEGFDSQACGGTHVRSTAEVGRFTIFRTENKGRNNKRLYVRLTD